MPVYVTLAVIVAVTRLVVDGVEVTVVVAGFSRHVHYDTLVISDWH